MQGRRRGARLTFPACRFGGDRRRGLAFRADGDRTAERRQRRRQAGDFAPPEIQRQPGTVGDQRQMLPLPLRQGLAGGSALTVQLDEGRALGQADQQGVAAFAARQQDLFAGQLVGTHPAAEAEGATGAHRQRWAGRQQQRLAQQLRGATDDALHRTAGGGLRIVGVGGGVPRRSARRTVEVIDQGVVRVEHRLAVAALRRLGVAVVHPDVLALATLHPRHVDPDQGHAHQRVEALDLVAQHGLVVGGDEANVRAVLVDPVEGEVAGMQAHQQRQATETLVDRRALRGGIDRDLLAVLPVVLPPGTGAGRGQQAQADQRCQQ
ncbi:Uncharacterised protein [Acinetobacter baumannii]|nr:Uncharacterised protein [Acinetobacter baumannii]